MNLRRKKFWKKEEEKYKKKKEIYNYKQDRWERERVDLQQVKKTRFIHQSYYIRWNSSSTSTSELERKGFLKKKLKEKKDVYSYEKVPQERVTYTKIMEKTGLSALQIHHGYHFH